MSKEFLGDLFLAENEQDEASQLMGKVNALHGIWRTMPEIIDEHLIGAIFCFAKVRDAEIEQLSKDSEQYLGWYTEEQNKLKEAEKKLEAMEDTVEHLQKLLNIKTEEIKGLEG